MGNVHCSKPGCCCRLMGRPPPPICCDASCYACTKCCMLPPERHILLVGRSNSGKTHLLYRFLGASNPKPETTKGFSSTVRYDETNTQCLEFFDVSGGEAERPFWRTLYTNVLFNDIVYVIDPLEYRQNKEKLSEDRQEIHTLLAEPELQEAQFIVYFNWKKLVGDSKDAELKKEEKAQIQKDILQDLELTGFRDYVKDIIDPNVKLGTNAEAARKAKADEYARIQLDKVRQKAAASKQKEDDKKKEAKDGKADEKGKDTAKNRTDFGKVVPVQRLEHALVVPIDSEDQLFVNLGMIVKAKSETKDADDEIADLI